MKSKEILANLIVNHGYDECCNLCRSNESLTVDHIIPRIKGGSNSIENMQILCKKCNCKKRDLNLDHYKNKELFLSLFSPKLGRKDAIKFFKIFEKLDIKSQVFLPMEYMNRKNSGRHSILLQMTTPSEQSKMLWNVVRS